MDKSWFSRFKSEITSFWIWTLTFEWKMRHRTLTCIQPPLYPVHWSRPQSGSLSAICCSYYQVATSWCPRVNPGEVCALLSSRAASKSFRPQDFHKAMEAWTIDFKGTDSQDWLRNKFILSVCALLVNASCHFSPILAVNDCTFWLILSTVGQMAACTLEGWQGRQL